MAVLVAMLRGVNVGGKNPVRMETLRALCGTLGCTDVATYLQSGNIVFRTKDPNGAALNRRLEAAIEAEFGFAVPVVLRTAAEMQAVVAGNPFPGQALAEPGKVQVTFLYADPGETRRAAVRAMTFAPELVHLAGSEIYTYYPLGQGQSKLRWGPVDKALATSGTARNWNSVVKLLAMAEAMESTA